MQINRSSCQLCMCNKEVKSLSFFGCSDMQCGVWAYSTDVYKANDNNTSCGAKPWCRGTRPFTSRKNCKIVLHLWLLFPDINVLTTIEALKLSKEAHIDIYRRILLLIMRKTNLYVSTLISECIIPPIRKYFSPWRVYCFHLAIFNLQSATKLLRHFPQIWLYTSENKTVHTRPPFPQFKVQVFVIFYR